MTKEMLVQLWVDQLRYGNYNQCRNTFKGLHDEICAVQVLKEILIKLDIVDYTEPILSTNKHQFATEELLSIANYNDVGYTFEEIADYLEETYLGKKELQHETSTGNSGKPFCCSLA